MRYAAHIDLNAYLADLGQCNHAMSEVLAELAQRAPEIASHLITLSAASECLADKAHAARHVAR